MLVVRLLQEGCLALRLLLHLNYLCISELTIYTVIAQASISDIVEEQWMIMDLSVGHKCLLWMVSGQNGIVIPSEITYRLCKVQF